MFIEFQCLLDLGYYTLDGHSLENKCTKEVLPYFNAVYLTCPGYGLFYIYKFVSRTEYNGLR